MIILWLILLYASIIIIIFHNYCFEIDDFQLESMTNIPSFVGSDAPMSFFGVQDEYDPLKPNDYESFIKLRREDKTKDREETR